MFSSITRKITNKYTHELLNKLIMKNKKHTVKSFWIGDAPEYDINEPPFDDPDAPEVLPELKHKQRIKRIKEKPKALKPKRNYKEYKKIKTK